MPNYSDLYKELSQAVARATDILQEAQIRTGEIYDQQYENKSGDNNPIDKESLRKIIGKNIQTLRLKHSMSIEELSDKLEITPGYLGLLENGLRSTTAYNLSRLSNIFNISADDLFKPLDFEPK